jgi:hypothetical protein
MRWRIRLNRAQMATLLVRKQEIRHGTGEKGGDMPLTILSSLACC